MILITGGTGFIGKSLIKHLNEMGYPVRILIRPSKQSPQLPQGVAVDATVSSLADERGLRAAMVGIDTIYHLASGEWYGTQASLLNTDIKGTQAVVNAAKDAGVQSIFYLSHLGADRSSAYPVLKAKAIAEEYIRRSGINYTIVRSSLVYGPNDHFTTGLSQLLGVLPFIFLIPGDGSTLIQPIWVDDIATALTWSLENEQMINKTVSIGGPEYLQFKRVIELIMQEIGIHRMLLGIKPYYLRWITIFLESMLPNIPTSVYWIDYLAANRTCPLDSMPRIFNLMPARFTNKISYLHNKPWKRSLIKNIFEQRR
jgi:NADH dehydrogenase